MCVIIYNIITVFRKIDIFLPAELYHELASYLQMHVFLFIALANYLLNFKVLFTNKLIVNIHRFTYWQNVHDEYSFDN